MITIKESNLREALSLIMVCNDQDVLNIAIDVIKSKSLPEPKIVKRENLAYSHADFYY